MSVPVAHVPDRRFLGSRRLGATMMSAAAAVALTFVAPATAHHVQELDAPSTAQSERAEDKPVGNLVDLIDRTQVEGPQTGEASPTGVTVKVRVLKVQTVSGGAIRTRVTFRVVGKRRGLRRQFRLIVPGGKRGKKTVRSSAWPMMRRGMTLKATFLYVGGRWYFTAAKQVGGVSSAWVAWRSKWPRDRMPVRWRTPAAYPSWAMADIHKAFAWIVDDPLSYPTATYSGVGGSSRAQQCSQGSAVSFRQVDPYLGISWACEDSRGRYAIDVWLDPDPGWGGRYDLATVAAHEAMHGYGLDHSPDRNAVMHSPYIRRHDGLGADDAAGLRALYPESGGRPPDDPGARDAGLALGSTGNGQLGVGLNADGRQQVYLVGQNSQLYTNYQAQQNGGWASWVSLGGTWP